MYIGILPVNIRRNKFITDTSKVVYAEITASIGDDMSCSMSNFEFSEAMNVSEKTITKCLAELSAREFIDVQVVGNKRNIYLPEKVVFVEEKDKEKSKSEEGVTELSNQIVEYWNTMLESKIKATNGLKRNVGNRLKSFTKEEIFSAIVNRVMFVNTSEWHNMDENHHHKTNIDLVLRDDKSMQKALSIDTMKIKSSGVQVRTFSID